MPSFTEEDRALLDSLVPIAHHLAKLDPPAFEAWIAELSGHQRTILIRWFAEQRAQRPSRQMTKRILPLQTHACQVCGAPLNQPATGRRRQFCSDACRQRWHRTPRQKS